MVDLPVVSLSFLDFWSFEHPVLLSVVVSSFLHGVVTTIVLQQASGLFNGRKRHDATGSSRSVNDATGHANVLSKFSGVSNLRARLACILFLVIVIGIHFR